MLEVRFMESFQVIRNGTELELPKSKKARALLAYLAHEAIPQNKAHLTHLFFADTADPRGGLRWVISRLRNVLGVDALDTDRDFVALTPNWESDLTAAKSALSANASKAYLINCADRLKGGFLDDLSLPRLADYEAWRINQQVHCGDLLLRLLHQLTERHYGRAEAIEFARQAVAINPMLESSWVHHVRALLAIDHVAEARKVQQLAMKYLDDHGSIHTGELSTLWSQHKQKGEPNYNNRRLAPRVGVLSCSGSDAMSESAATATIALSRAASVNKVLTVIAPSFAQSAFESPNGASDPLHPEYWLQSHLASNGEERLLTVDLLDATTGAGLHTWRQTLAQSDKLGRDVEARFAARLELDLPLTLIKQLNENDPQQLTPREHYLLALPRIFTPDGFDPVGALSHLEQALAKMPHFGPALCGMALIRTFLPNFNDDDDEIASSLSMARRAIEMCQDDAFVLAIAAIVLAQYDRETDAALQVAARARSLNPYSVMAGIASSYVSHFAALNGPAWEHICETERHVDPDPLSFLTCCCRAMIKYQTREYEQSLQWSSRAIGYNPKFIISLRYHLASLGQLGLMEQAAPLAHQLVEYDASETLAFFRRRSAYKDPEMLEHLCEGLSKAGLA